ncbi:MAG: AlpA family phage regulatory protein [Burkholderiaceae bacterium]|nr:AlpA family phage regulatory protein [Burkholderiaceae bacterium]
MHHTTQLPETGYLRLPEVLYYYPISKSTWWAGVKSGRYPQGHKLSKRCTAWKAEDIRALLQQGGLQ